jgi:hypothetical protein
MNQYGQQQPGFGQAEAMSPPEINIDFAPPPKSTQEHQEVDRLQPPERCE